MSWVLNRLQEPSTWRGLVWLLTAAGLTVSPDLAAAIAAAGMALAGLIGVVTKEQAKKVEIMLPPVDFIARSSAGGMPVQSVPDTSIPDEPRNGSGWNG